MHIRRVEPRDFEEWLRMRQVLWPGEAARHRLEMQEILSDQTSPVFVAERPGGSLGGFLEAGLRKYADGCDTSPVGYIEGWHVDEDLRRLGVGGQLVRAAEDWARRLGCREMASDCDINNLVSLQAHKALGYQEAERLIHFRKEL
jgi:aminoglycoside 6'-N-acetyltransferase I